MKILAKLETLNAMKIYLFNKFLLKTKNKKKRYTEVFSKLRKYADIAINSIPDKQEEKESNNIIWQLWLQGENNMPEIIKTCVNSIKKHCSDQKIILLTSENLKEYVKLPDYIEEKYKAGIIPTANYSDMICLYLLYNYGGTWVDSTILLTDCIPQYIIQSDLFMFRTPLSINLENIKSIDQYEILCKMNKEAITILSSWFIHAKAKNIFIKTILDMFYEYWREENTLIDYFLIERFFVISIIFNELCRLEFLKIPMFSSNFPHLLQLCLFEKFDGNLFNNIKEMCFLHKLTYKNLDKNRKDSFLNHILQSERSKDV